MMRWYLFTYIVLVNYFIIGTNTWLCICLFLQINHCIKWTVILNVPTREVWISYSITVWCIKIILFVTVDVWFNSSISTIIRLGKTFLPCFLLYDINTISIYFSILKQYLYIIRINLKMEKTFNTMITKQLLITWKI